MRKTCIYAKNIQPDNKKEILPGMWIAVIDICKREMKDRISKQILIPSV